MPPPDLSAIIPLRNRSGVRLENCLRSLRWQTVPAAGVEIVLSDFGSDPGHAASIAALAARYGARVVRTATDEVWNRARALNIGIRAATAPVVFCTDADMIFAPDFLASVLQAHRESGDAIVFCRCHDLPAEVPEQLWQVEDFTELHRRAALRDTTGTGACQVARKAFFEQVRGYDEAFVYWGAEDDDLRVRALRAGLQPRWVTGRTAMLHQWHPTMKADRPFTRFVNTWRYRLTRHRVVKNPQGWGGGP